MKNLTICPACHIDSVELNSRWCEICNGLWQNRIAKLSKKVQWVAAPDKQEVIPFGTFAVAVLTPVKDGITIECIDIKTAEFSGRRNIITSNHLSTDLEVYECMERLGTALGLST